jgi:hypothetical protein
MGRKHEVVRVLYNHLHPTDMIMISIGEHSPESRLV